MKHLFGLLMVLLGFVADGQAQTLDLADPANRGLWFSHPVVGDVSYDSFQRADGNPIYTGSKPYEWPVNGFLFQDKPSGDLYCYISLYPRGYWPAGPERVMRSRDCGKHWEDLGIILQGDPNGFDGDGKKAGATLDATVVQDEQGYHMAYGWAKPDNSDGGLAYAFARSPAGPWIRDPKPIHAESAQSLIPPGYKRVYASSLIKRAKDWIILASMSTPGNAGGMWASVCLTAPAARGPYSPPIFLHRPQGGQWTPQPIEFFPAFVHGEYVYASHTSVAASRGYQLICRAKIEDAHKPEAWMVWQSGSVFHAEANEHEAYGIWGQTFSGFVGDDGVFRIMYPSRNLKDCGTINIASRPWDTPYQRGFWLSGPDGPMLGLVMLRFGDVRVEAELEASEAWKLVWNHRGPLGPSGTGAGTILSPLCRRDMTTLSMKDGTWQVDEYAGDGAAKTLARGSMTGGKKHRVVLEQKGKQAVVRYGEQELCKVDLSNVGGGVGLIAEKGCCLHARRFMIQGKGEHGSWFLLPMEGLLNAGNDAKAWKERKTGFRYASGFAASFDTARAKWNFTGRGAKLWLPRGSEYGELDVYLDDRKVERVNLRADTDSSSAVVWDSGEIPPGNHAVMIVRASGLMPVDCLVFDPF